MLGLSCLDAMSSDSKAETFEDLVEDLVSSPSVLESSGGGGGAL